MASHFYAFAQLRRLWPHLRSRRKKQLIVLVVLMIVTSIAEVMSISAVFPFLGVLTYPETIFAHDLVQPFVQLFQIQSAQGLLLPFTIIFIVTTIFAGFTRMAMLWVQTRLSIAIGTDFSLLAYERTLYQPYILHLSRNSSEILAGVTKAFGLVGYLIQPTMLACSSAAILVAVVTTLLSIQPVIAIAAFLGFGLIYATVVSTTKRRIAKNSLTIATQHGRVTKAIQEGLGGIRDVLIDGTQPVYSKLYKDAFIPMQSASASNQVITASPRFVVEALGMILIAGLAYLLAGASEVSGGMAGVIPILGALALGAQRLLPVFQQIYAAYITVQGNKESIHDALDLLDQPVPIAPDHTQLSKPIEFEIAVTLRDLGFRYTPQGPWVLRNINLQIPKGSRVGFIGVTGSGKSTLIDILMGLLSPTEGAIFIDNVAINPKNPRPWQRLISHVPQEIYLSDTSIAENIAFGTPAELIDLQRVKRAAQQAQIANTVESLSAGYHTMVGERGVRLSGGQRQRIGIARALYKRSNVIIFDEATSALDNETEAAVMEAVETLDRGTTLLVVAHRLSTLRSCDFIYELIDGNIKLVGDYASGSRHTA